jgi:hypothetical protein
MTISPVLLRRWYFVLAGMGTLAALQAIILPKWPSATPLPQAELDSRIKAGGLNAQKLPSRPPTRTYDLASSTQLVWKLPDGEELTLMQGSSREQMNFQVAFLSRAEPSLQIKNRVIITNPLPLASGQHSNRPILQTCMLRGSDGRRGLGVTGEQLIEARSQLPSSKLQRLYEVLGLKPSAMSTCVLVTLKGSQHQSTISAKLMQNIIQAIAPAVVSLDHAPHQSGPS